MTKLTTLLFSLMFFAAPFAVAESGTEGPLALTGAQMDQITAGQSAVPTAAAAALADATGSFTEVGTNAAGWVIANRVPGMAPTYVTVTTASGNAVASGPGAQSSVSTSMVNEQSVPDDSIVSTAVQHSITVLGTTIAFESQMKMGGNSIYYFNNPPAIFGR